MENTVSPPDPTAPDDERTPRQKLIDNERARLTATALNNSAVAAFVTSVVGPVASDLYGITAPKTAYWWLFGLCWLTGSALLHFGARSMLERLEP
jgi:fatty acid desaturase